MEDPEVRRSSDVLDAIWEKVADQPKRSDSATLIFRAKALDQLDVAAEVDNQLPLVSRRSWLLAAGVAVLVAAFALWASLTPSVTSIQAPARMVAAPGALPVVSPVPGVVTEIAVTTGDVIAAGQQIASLQSADGSTAVTSSVAGTVWQVPVVPGTAIAAGGPVLTVLPPGSDRSALVPVPEGQAVSIQPGMDVKVSANAFVSGTVTAVSAPMSAESAGQRTGIELPPTTMYAVVEVALDEALAAGSAGSAQVILSDGTVITRLLGI